MISAAVLSLQHTEAREMEDFASIMELRDPATGRFDGISTGEEITFVDHVSISYSFEDPPGFLRTRVYLGSTGASDSSPNLTYPGDLTGILKPGAKVRFTLVVLSSGEGNTSGQYLLADKEKMEVMEEGEGVEKIIQKDIIDVFGFKIHKEDLPDFLQSDWARFGLSIAIWIGIIAIAWFIFRLLLLFTKKTKTNMDHTIVRIVRLPFFLLIFVYGIIISLSQLDVPDYIIGMLDTLYRAIAIIIVTIVIIKLFKHVLLVYLGLMSKKTETQADDVLVPVFGKIMTVVIWIFASIMFLRTFGFDATALLGAAGIAGLVIAFAAQDTLSNFFAGIMILLDRPFKEGDWIDLDGSVYLVKHIGLRSTRLFSSWTNQVVTLPNSKMASLKFSNLTEPDVLGRKTVDFSVSYGSDIEKVMKIVDGVVRSNPGVVADDGHPVIIRFNDFGDSSLNWSVTFFVRDYNDQWAIASDIRKEIYRSFTREEIEIPFPQVDVHLKKNTA